MMELERRGVPTVGFTASGFVRDAHRSAENFGLPGVAITVTALPFAGQSPESIRAMVDGAIDDVISGLTRPLDVSALVSEIVVVEDEVLEFEGSDLLRALDRMNRQFLAYGWSDGFPLVAPTAEAVEQMLGSTRRRPEEVIAHLEPGLGAATVQRIAVNAVMAGCRPEHLPVVVAATECIAEPRMMLRIMAMSTGPHAPLIVVNGPIARELGINAGVCALGPGAPSYANTVIGRALRLVMMNVGHTYPAVSDMDTVGSPTKYSMCVAENEAESPWAPYHVEKGFPRDASTVTVHFSQGICELHDFQNHQPERLVEVFCTVATNVAYTPAGGWLLGHKADPRVNVEARDHMFMLICPEHAHNFARAGWTKDRLREAMHRGAQMPFRLLMAQKEPKAFLAAHPELEWLLDKPETLLPVVETPDCFEMAVVGGQAGRGAYLFGCGEPVTKLVER